MNYLSGQFPSLIDRSGLILNGGVSQKVADKNPSRGCLIVQNISDTTMYVNFGSAATADNSIQLLPGGSITFNGAWVPGDDVYLLCSTSGKKFVCKEGV